MRMTSLALALAAGLLAGNAVAQTPQTGTSTPTTRPPATAPAKPTTPTVTTPPTTPAAKLLDINTASKEELDALPGIGAARSEAIIKGRPYKSKDELVRKKIIPQSVYNGIKDRIVARQG